MTPTARTTAIVDDMVATLAAAEIDNANAGVPYLINAYHMGPAIYAPGLFDDEQDFVCAVAARMGWL